MQLLVLTLEADFAVDQAALKINQDVQCELSASRHDLRL
jgi:hypothetical protein